MVTGLALIGRGVRLAARTSGCVKKVAALGMARGLPRRGLSTVRVETAGGGRGLATAFFAQGLYIVAAVAVWFQTQPRFTTAPPDLNIVAPEFPLQFVPATCVAWVVREEVR